MSDSSSEPPATTSKPGKPKRLTLQERLALAAKTKKKVSSGVTKDSPTLNSQKKSQTHSETNSPGIKATSSQKSSLSSEQDTEVSYSAEAECLINSIQNLSIPTIDLVESMETQDAGDVSFTSNVFDTSNVLDSETESSNQQTGVVESDNTPLMSNDVNEEEPNREDIHTNQPEQESDQRSEQQPEQQSEQQSEQKSKKEPFTSDSIMSSSEVLATSGNFDALNTVQAQSVDNSKLRIELENSNLKSEKENSKLKFELEKLKSIVESLNKTITVKNQELESAKKETSSPALEKKLKDKDEIIAQLMKEGSELSAKEIKLNERVRTLLSQNRKLESSLNEYAEKSEQCLFKIQEIEDVIKQHKFSSIDQLLDSLSNSNHQLLILQGIIDHEKRSNWEGKYKELQKLYDASIEEQQALRKEVSEKSVKLELLENLSSLEIRSKDELISRLNQHIINAKDEASVELSRLESKIEQLRLENESFLRNGHTENAANIDSSGGKQIDYQDYAKLLQVNHNLQEQFISSQETWRMIETELRLKIETLNTSVDVLRKAKSKASGELKKLLSQISRQAEEISSLQAEVYRLTELEVETCFKLKMKIIECEELEEQIGKLRIAFETEKNTNELKVQTLLETITALQNNPPEFLTSVLSDNISLQNRKYSVDHFQNARMENRPPMRLQSLNSLNFPIYPNLTLNTPMTGWEELFPLHRELSSQAHTVNSEIFPQDAADSESSNTPVRSSLGATKNIQIISKMSSNIRRLEMDLMTLKEENEELLREKEQAQQEIVGLLDLKKGMGELEAHAKQLNAELEEKTKKEETLLQVIGEKTEKVEELEADVSDLKDLMRQQVQQMIEMQSH